jgi:nucleotidyltransferase/DNA polymerase involved in DNA repair
LKDIAPNFTATSNIDDIIDNQLRQQGIDPTQVSPDQRAALHSQVSQQLNLPVTGQESLADIVTSRFNQTLQRITQVNALSVALLAVVLSFFTIRALIPLVTWALLAAIAAGMWFARSIGLVVTLKEAIQVEQLTL